MCIQVVPALDTSNNETKYHYSIMPLSCGSVLHIKVNVGSHMAYSSHQQYLTTCVITMLIRQHVKLG